mgnify:CR=1 FL=1
MKPWPHESWTPLSRPKAKKIYQRFGKLVEKGVEDFYKEEELQVGWVRFCSLVKVTVWVSVATVVLYLQSNAIRIEAILNGEKVHGVSEMEEYIARIFRKLSWVLAIVHLLTKIAAG